MTRPYELQRIEMEKILSDGNSMGYFKFKELHKDKGIDYLILRIEAVLQERECLALEWKGIK